MLFIEQSALKQIIHAFRVPVIIVGVLIASLTVGLVVPAAAQSRYDNRYSDRNTLGGLLGDIVRAGQRSSAEKKWQSLAAPMQDCMSRALSTRGYTTASLINQGIGPDDARLNSMSTRCQSLLTRELQRDIECTIVELGVSVITRCNEAYALATNAQARVIGRDQYILEGLRGENVVVTQVETSEARQSRVAVQEQQQASAEAQLRQQQAAAETQFRQQQAAEDASAKKQADDARQKQAAANAAIQQALAKRDQAIASQRKACVVKAGPNAFSRLFSNNSDNQVLSSLLDTNVAPLKAYQGAIAWLPSTGQRSVLLTALRDRMEYDVKRFGLTVSRSGSGNYSWENLKSALDSFASNCLWQEHDYLAIGSAQAMSSRSVAVALGTTQASSAAERVGGIALSRIPSARLLSLN